MISLANENVTICSSYGINDLTSYRYNFPLTSSDENSDLQLYMPIYSSFNLNESSSSIKYAIINIHGLLRNADEVLCLGLLLIQGRNDTIIIAPYFSMDQIESIEWGYNIQDVTSDYLSAYWNTSSWLSGGDNCFDSRGSYDAIDNLISYVDNNLNFPSLEIITIAGFSAGAQTVNRYAWASDIDKNITSKIRYILSDASSYLYLDGHRPVSKCIPKLDQEENITCEDFEFPSNDTIKNCSEYDEWKYGISKFPDSSYSYLTKLLSDSIPLSDRNDLFLKKNITYVLGKQDACNCQTSGYINPDYCYIPNVTCTNNSGTTNCCDTYPDSLSNDLSTTCESNMQGFNRFQRGLVYMSYLEWYSGIKQKYLTMDLMHNCTVFFLSDELKQTAFDL